MNGKITAELYRSLLLLGADHQLLGTVGSLVDGAPEEYVLDNLQAWNESTLQELKARTQSYEELYSSPAYTRDERRKTA